MKIEKYAITGLIIIILCTTYIIIFPPPESYVLSIYMVYPVELWIGIIISCSIAVFILTRNREEKLKIPITKDIPTKLATITLALANIVVLSLPLFQHYAMYGRNDPLVHAGYVRDILISGNIGTDFYPLSHILVVEIAKLLDISEYKIMLLLVPTYYIVYVVGVYVIYKRITLRYNIKSSNFVIAFMLVSLTQIYTTQFFPYSFSIYYFPLIIWLLIMLQFRKSNALLFTLLILLFSNIFLHPLGFFFLLVITLVYSLVYSLSVNIKQSKFPFIYLSIALLVVYLTWISHFWVFKGVMLNTYKWITGVSSPQYFQYYTKTVEKYKLPLDVVIRNILKIYGHYILFGIFNLYLLVNCYIKKYIKKMKIYTSNNSLSLFIRTIFLVYIFLIFFFFFRLFSGPSIFAYPTRELLLIFYFSALLNGVIYSNLITKNISIIKSKRLSHVFLFVLILVSLIISIFSAHPSPFSDMPNEQITFADFRGGMWAVKNILENNTHATNKVLYYSNNDFGSLFTVVLLGKERSENSLLKIQTSPHFTQVCTNTNSKYPKTNGYLFITEFPVAVFELWGNKSRYTLEDFQRLRIRVGIIYANNGFTIYLITN